MLNILLYSEVKSTWWTFLRGWWTITNTPSILYYPNSRAASPEDRERYTKSFLPTVVQLYNESTTRWTLKSSDIYTHYYAAYCTMYSRDNAIYTTLLWWEGGQKVVPAIRGIIDLYWLIVISVQKNAVTENFMAGGSHKHSKKEVCNCWSFL